MKGRPNNLVTRIKLHEADGGTKHADEMEKKLVAAQAASVTADAKEVKGVPFLAQEVKVQDVDALRKMGDTSGTRPAGWWCWLHP